MSCKLCVLLGLVFTITFSNARYLGYPQNSNYDCYWRNCDDFDNGDRYFDTSSENNRRFMNEFNDRDESELQFAKIQTNYDSDNLNKQIQHMIHPIFNDDHIERLPQISSESNMNLIVKKILEANDKVERDILNNVRNQLLTTNVEYNRFAPVYSENIPSFQSQDDSYESPFSDFFPETFPDRDESERQFFKIQTNYDSDNLNKETQHMIYPIFNDDHTERLPLISSHISESNMNLLVKKILEAQDKVERDILNDARNQLLTTNVEYEDESWVPEWTSPSKIMCTHEERINAKPNTQHENDDDLKENESIDLRFKPAEETNPNQNTFTENEPKFDDYDPYKPTSNVYSTNSNFPDQIEDGYKNIEPIHTETETESPKEIDDYNTTYQETDNVYSEIEHVTQKKPDPVYSGNTNFNFPDQKIESVQTETESTEITNQEIEDEHHLLPKFEETENVYMVLPE